MFLSKLLSRAAAHGQIARRGSAMVLWRLAALGIGAVGTIYVARCMGAESLGISAMVAATCVQIGLFVRWNQDAHYIRLFKKLDDDGARLRVVQGAYTLRFVNAAVLALLAGAILLYLQPPSYWWVAILAGVPLLFLDQNPPNWILQAQENQPAQYKATAIKGVVITTVALLFFHPGMPPGFDLALTAGGTALAWFAAWHWAVGGGVTGLATNFNWGAMKEILPELRKSHWLVLTGFVIYGYSQFQLPLIGYLSPLRDVGMFRSATALTDVANSFLVMIPALLYPRYIEWHKQGAAHLWAKQISLFRGLLCAIIPIAGLVLLLSPWVYPRIFGLEFANASSCFSLLLISKLVVVLNGIFGWGLWAQGADRINLIIMTATAVISVGLNLQVIPRFGIVGAAAVNLASESLILIGCAAASRRLALR